MTLGDLLGVYSVVDVLLSASLASDLGTLGLVGSILRPSLTVEIREIEYRSEALAL